LLPEHAIHLLEIGDHVALLLLDSAGQRDTKRRNRSGCESEDIAHRIDETRTNQRLTAAEIA
jgi:hypothetical protein